MMPFTPDVDIADYLDAQVTTVALTKGTNIFHGPVRPVQDSVVGEVCVFVLPLPGSMPQSMMSSSDTEWAPEYQIWVRGAKNAYATAQALAREIRNLMQSDGSPVLTGYTDVQALDSEPYYRGEDGDGRPEFTIDVKVIFYE